MGEPSNDAWFRAAMAAQETLCHVVNAWAQYVSDQAAEDGFAR